LIHSIVDTIDFICLFSDFQAIKTLKFLSFGIRAIRYPEFLFIFPAIRKKKKKNQPNLIMCERVAAARLVVRQFQVKVDWVVFGCCGGWLMMVSCTWSWSVWGRPTKW